jgi:FlaA1/EpsC-like NDP-sugar epimerase
MGHNLADFFSGKTVAVTGACGTVGNALLSRILDASFGIERIVALDNSESALFELVSNHRDKRIEAVFSDIRDYNSLSERLRGVNVLFHCAALKHVNICEKSPIDAIRTNVLSTQNVIDASIENRISDVVFSSSDKAVNPTNVLGASKLLGEKLMTAAHKRASQVGTKLMSVRFGNVLGSSGSVFHIFKKQIKTGSPITITNNDMSRFVMTRNQAVDLILDAPRISTGGDLVVLKMPAIYIKDLAVAMNNIYSRNHRSVTPLEMVEIGASFGEKIYEELMNVEEVSRAVDHENCYRVLPVGFDASSPQSLKTVSLDRYNSALEVKLTVEQIEDLIEKSDLKDWWLD